METTVNERIKLLREHLNMTQSDFAQKTETTATTINRIEKGTTTPQKGTLNRIINEFSCSRDWLVSGIGEMFSQEPLQTHSNTWRDEAYAALRNRVEAQSKEIEWLRSVVSRITGAPDFLLAIDQAGVSSLAA